MLLLWTLSTATRKVCDAFEVKSALVHCVCPSRGAPSAFLFYNSLHQIQNFWANFRNQINCTDTDSSCVWTQISCKTNKNQFEAIEKPWLLSTYREGEAVGGRGGGGARYKRFDTQFCCTVLQTDVAFRYTPRIDSLLFTAHCE